MVGHVTLKHHFQNYVQKVGRPEVPSIVCSRSDDADLVSFITTAMNGTRAQHRVSLHDSRLCSKSEFEIIDVAIVLNPIVDNKFCNFIHNHR